MPGKDSGADIYCRIASAGCNRGGGNDGYAQGVEGEDGMFCCIDGAYGEQCQKIKNLCKRDRIRVSKKMRDPEEYVKRKLM
jgi:hypothetical protein